MIAIVTSQSILLKQREIVFRHYPNRYEFKIEISLRDAATCILNISRYIRSEITWAYISFVRQKNYYIYWKHNKTKTCIEYKKKCIKRIFPDEQQEAGKCFIETIMYLGLIVCAGAK